MHLQPSDEHHLNTHKKWPDDRKNIVQLYTVSKGFVVYLVLPAET